MTKPIYSLLIVEDDPDIRRFLCSAVASSSNLKVVASVGTLSEARACICQQMPDVLLVDLGLPDGSGIELIRMARTGKKKAECMVITIHADKFHLMPALEAGATGYLLKDAMPEDIHASIIDLLHGGSPISPLIARTLLQRFERPDKEMKLVENLTEREIAVLKALTRGLTRREIASLLNVSSHTIHSHVKNIYGKLEVNSNVEAVQKAQRLRIVESDCL